MYKKVQEVCKRRGVTISKLETSLHFPKGSVYKWTKHRPSIDKVKAAADFLQVPIEELI